MATLPPALKARLLKKGILESSSSSSPSSSSVSGCPNAVNPYHECSDYCRERWGGGGATTSKPPTRVVKVLPINARRYIARCFFLGRSTRGCDAPPSRLVASARRKDVRILMGGAKNN